MLKNIIDLLQIDDFYDGNHDVQVAKGLYNLETGFWAIWKQKKREQNLKKAKRWQKNEL